MTPEENKALVRRFYEEIDKGNLDAMDELVAEDYIDHNPPPFPGLASGRAGLKQAFEIFWKATPGYHHIEDQIAEGDKVVTRMTSFGKHVGDLPGAPATGNEMKMTSITLHRIADGKLAEKWAEKDVMGFLTQIGVIKGLPRDLERGDVHVLVGRRRACPTICLMLRPDGRAADQIRPVTFDLGIAPHASGSVLVAMGNTRVICAVMIEETIPRWMREQGVSGGWLTAEYSMLSYSTNTRKPRDITKGRLDGRTTEIQRLIGRSLRAVVDLEKLGPRTMWVDCDVLQADGGTRTAAITGASLAVAIACRKLADEKKIDVPPIRKLVAAVSTGVLDGESILDLNYEEDKAVSVAFNLVATEDGEFVELQGSGEETTFSSDQLAEMLTLGKKGIAELIAAQRAVLASLMVQPG